MISHFLKDEVVHWTYGTTNDGYGNPIPGWVEGDTLAACIRPLSGDKRLSRDKDTVYADYKVYLDYNADIKTGDELRWGGKKYEVKLPHNPMSMDRFLQVEVSLKDG